MSDMISLSGLSRKLDKTVPVLQRLLRAGVIKPHSRAGRSLLFDAQQLPAIRDAVAGALASKRGVQ